MLWFPFYTYGALGPPFWGLRPQKVVYIKKIAESLIWVTYTFFMKMNTFWDIFNQKIHQKIKGSPFLGLRLILGAKYNFGGRFCGQGPTFLGRRLSKYILFIKFPFKWKKFEVSTIIRRGAIWRFLEKNVFGHHLGPIWRPTTKFHESTYQ